MRTIVCILASMIALGCGRSGESTGPSSDPPAAFAAAAASIELELVPLEAGRMPIAVAVRAGDEVRRVGPLQQWRESLPAAPTAGPLWVDPLPVEATSAFYPLWVTSPPGALRLPLVPRVRLPGTLYLELIDLLQEFLAPFAGSRVRRWGHHPITVALPEGAWPVDYAAACSAAIDAWNDAVGEVLLVVAAPGAAADVHCEVAEADPLAFTKLLATDEAGHPTAMLVHVSPRWQAGSERYVRRTYLHEMGHVIGLWGHSRDLQHVVNGRAVIRDQLHPDEVRAAQWLWHLPADFDLVCLRRPPRQGAPVEQEPVTRCAAAMERGIAAIRPR